MKADPQLCCRLAPPGRRDPEGLREVGGGVLEGKPLPKKVERGKQTTGAFGGTNSSAHHDLPGA